jgi:hypothetical protein
MKADDCPDRHTLAVLLVEEADEAAPASATHLEACVACQQALTDLAAEQTTWEEIARTLPRLKDHFPRPGQSPTRAPALERAMAELKREAPGQKRRPGDTATRRRGEETQWGALAPWILGCFLLGLLALQLTDVPGASEPQTEFEHSLKGSSASAPGFRFIGPDAGKCVRFEPEGLRITLPLGYPGERPHTGLSTGIAVKGDFEITVRYEVLQEPEPEAAGRRATPLNLLLVLDQEQWSVAGLSRRMAGGRGPQYTTWTSIWTPEAQKTKGHFRAFPATGKTGRLRFVRQGSALSYYVAEGAAPEFTFLHETPFSDQDLKDVRVIAFTGGPEAAFDVRVNDLHIRAGSFTPTVAANRPFPWAKGGLAAVLLLGLLLSLALLVWLHRRSRREVRDQP